jgi:hypothetical protein
VVVRLRRGGERREGVAGLVWLWRGLVFQVKYIQYLGAHIIWLW